MQEHSRPRLLDFRAEEKQAIRESDKRRGMVRNHIAENLDGILSGNYSLENLRKAAAFGTINALKTFLTANFFTNDLRKIVNTIKQANAGESAGVPASPPKPEISATHNKEAVQKWFFRLIERSPKQTEFVDAVNKAIAENSLPPMQALLKMFNAESLSALKKIMLARFDLR